MPVYEPINAVFDLTDPQHNMVHNMPLAEVRRRVATGDVQLLKDIDGHFAVVAVEGQRVRMARTLGIPMRYFIAKGKDGPLLVVSDRIDTIRNWLLERGMGDQFHPSYTRMVPAHYITEIALVGCPDPNPVYRRFFTPSSEKWTGDKRSAGGAYVGALVEEIVKWLHTVPEREPIGVCFSGGVDSGAVLLATHHAMLTSGMNPARLKAFTLSVDSGGKDLIHARQFLREVELSFLHEVIDVTSESLDFRDTIATIEDYKLVDVQAATMVLALARGIRQRYPEWKYLIDGDGGDENLKDYPIEDNPELTIRSVLNNRLLYQEGWGVDSIKHSLTFSGGLSRSFTRTFAPLRSEGFVGFSPFTLPKLIHVAEQLPFIDWTDWSHEKLYSLKGELLQLGVHAITEHRMPIFPKTRFQHGATDNLRSVSGVWDEERACRRRFAEIFGG